MTRWVSLSVDLDPLRCYAEHRGLSLGRRTNPNAVYDDGLPRLLELLARLGLPATLFAVGREASQRDNARILCEAVRQGHEVASHSHTHPPNLAELSGPALLGEIADAEHAIEEATGMAVEGFRAPGWNVSVELYRLLLQRGYRYDSSLVPLPASRLWSLLPRLAPGVFGGRVFAGQGRWPKPPARPYRLSCEEPWRAGEGSALWELPHGLTGGPVPLPLSATALALLGGRLERRVAAWAARRPETLVLVMHGIDLVDFDRHIGDPRLAVKPGIATEVDRKTRRIERLLGAFGRGRRYVRLSDLPDALGPGPRSSNAATMRSAARPSHRSGRP